MLTRRSFELTADVLIAGGGPAGAAAALSFARDGARVILLERRATPVQRMGESLSAAARAPLTELGVWSSFLALEPRPSYLVRSSWGGSVVERDAVAHGHGPDFHLDRARFDAFLVEHARAAGALVYTSSRLRGVERDGSRYRTLAVMNGADSVVHADFLIDATGRSASLARSLGARRSTADRLVGVARWFGDAPGEPCVLVEAADHGWWYSAPAPDGKLVVLFVTDAGTRAAHAARPDVWAENLASAPLTRERLAGARPLGSASAYAASPALTEWDTGERLLAVGDAALSFDPMSAQGLTFALRSGLEAARALLLERAGEERVRARYQAGIRGIYRDHLAGREALYDNERRARRTPFWLSARGAPASAAEHGGVSVPGVGGHALGVEVVEHARAAVGAHARA
jgi:flavin-dependent dehydrogenase